MTEPLIGTNTTLVPFTDAPVNVAFCDGGLIGNNGYTKLGTCAYAMGWLDSSGHLTIEKSGAFILQTGEADEVVNYTYPGIDALSYDLPPEYQNKISNNQAEWFAMMVLMAQLPDNWNGTIVCDSVTTIERWFHNQPMTGIHPLWLKLGHAEKCRMNGVKCLHVHGHQKDGDWKVQGNNLVDSAAKGYGELYCLSNGIDKRQFFRPRKAKETEMEPKEIVEVEAHTGPRFGIVG